MVNESCDLCGYKGPPESIEEHHIIPLKVTSEAGLPEARIIHLCHNCYQELNRWYSAKVADMTYDTVAKRFTRKPPPKMVQEYQFAFDMFLKYKKAQEKI